ncbi:MAG: stage II sporulation protein M [Gemmatimonadales bacterium]|nr:stage II sporulation protein M [Gemmatimonadales bacterium]
MADTPAPTYRQHFELETPEHVVLDYELAGVGSRALAALVDMLLVFILSLVVTVSLLFWGNFSGWISALQILLLYSLIWLYFALFEGLRRGQTPGKRMVGIRTIRESGHGLTFADAATRHLLTPIDMVGMIGLVLIAVHPRAKRLGDLVAGTVVVRDQPVEVARPAEPTEDAVDAETDGSPELADDEFALVREFIGRAPSLPRPVRNRFATQFAARFAGRFPDRPGDDFQFLQELYNRERGRRRGKFGARSGGGRRAVSERLLARKGARWDAFDLLAGRVARGGLDVLSAEELPDFAARYREVAADLARVRTYGADPVVSARLERLVAAGHNALYRAERRSWRRLSRFLVVEAPAAVVASWRTVLLAAALFIVPGVGGYALLREQPGLAPSLIPDVMLERAEAGQSRGPAGSGYVEVSAEKRPVMATSIIANNVRVAVACFASGVVFGVGSLLLLAFNGLQLGAVSGHFANLGVLGYLWSFVMGHGVLELFAIWVAGAAGFLLGRAVIVPGDYSRRDALVLASQRALPMVATAVVLLIVAGLIEGLISASTATLRARLLVSGGSALFLAIYLLVGWVASRRMVGARP